MWTKKIFCLCDDARCLSWARGNVSTTAQNTSDSFHDHYEVLQLSPNADSETISRVFRILVKRYHPDNTVTGDNCKFNDIVQAYRVLSDLEKRAAYDVKYDENRAAVMKI